MHIVENIQKGKLWLVSQKIKRFFLPSPFFCLYFWRATLLDAFVSEARVVHGV